MFFIDHVKLCIAEKRKTLKLYCVLAAKEIFMIGPVALNMLYSFPLQNLSKAVWVTVTLGRGVYRVCSAKVP